jgi:hypothetical protein
MHLKMKNMSQIPYYIIYEFLNSQIYLDDDFPLNRFLRFQKGVIIEPKGFNAKACSNFTLMTKNWPIIHNLLDKCQNFLSLYFENLNQAKRVVFEPMNPTNYHFNLPKTTDSIIHYNEL